MDKPRYRPTALDSDSDDDPIPGSAWARIKKVLQRSKAAGKRKIAFLDESAEEGDACDGEEEAEGEEEPTRSDHEFMDDRDEDEMSKASWSAD